MNNLKGITWTVSALAACSVSSSALAQTAKLTALPSGWLTTSQGSVLPASAKSGPLAIDIEWRSGSPTGVCSDGDASSACKLFAPIHTKLGTGAMAQASNSAAIYVSGSTLVLHTVKPSSSGAGGTDVNVETVDKHGHGVTITNGYIEVTAAIPGTSCPAVSKMCSKAYPELTAHGSHAGIWLLNVQTNQGHGEIDFPETYGSGDHVFTSAVHWWPTAASRFANEVHTAYDWSPNPYEWPYGKQNRYGVLLTSTQICTYLDGAQVSCTGRLPEMQGPFYALASVFTDANRKDGYQPATMRILSIKAWGG